jgi:hypothetical protein
MSVTNLVSIGSKRTTMNSRVSDGSQSQYTEFPGIQASRKSATVRPLELTSKSDFVQPGLNRVMSGSPTIAHASSSQRGFGFPLSQGMSGQIERSNSTSTVSSDGQNDDFSSGLPPHTSENNTWTPVGGQEWSDSRATSSLYAESALHPPSLATATQRDSSATQFPGAPESSLYNTRAQIPENSQSDYHSQHSDMSWLNLGKPKS